VEIVTAVPIVRVTAQKIFEALQGAIKNSQVAETLLKRRAPPARSIPQQLRRILRAAIRQFSELLDIAGAKMDGSP
jgi:hypothetical protein